VTLLLPVLAAIRVLDRKSRDRAGIATGLGLPGPVNALLYGVMEGERNLLLSWLDLPVGGSRIVAARAIDQ
jgi:hypothetical protein